MSDNKHGQRADKVSVENDGSFRRDGTPVLMSAPQGQIIEKAVEHYTMECPECGLEGRHKERGEVICDDPECAVVISEDESVSMEDFGQKTHNAAVTMGSSLGGTVARKPAGN